MLTLPAGASPTLVERLLRKIDMSCAHPLGCHLWTGAYNVDGRHHGRRHRGRRPVIQLGGQGSPVVYVAPLLLALLDTGELVRYDRDGQRLFALHTCRCHLLTADGWYRCVNIEHLQWGTQRQNELDKKQLERLEMSA